MIDKLTFSLIRAFLVQLGRRLTTDRERAVAEITRMTNRTSRCANIYELLAELVEETPGFTENDHITSSWSVPDEIWEALARLASACAATWETAMEEDEVLIAFAQDGEYYGVAVDAMEQVGMNLARAFAAWRFTDMGRLALPLKTALRAGFEGAVTSAETMERLRKEAKERAQAQGKHEPND